MYTFLSICKWCAHACVYVHLIICQMCMCVLYDFHICSYIYPVTIGTNMPTIDDYKYGVEQLFIDLLTTSQFSVSAQVSHYNSCKCSINICLWNTAYLFYV